MALSTLSFSHPPLINTGLCLHILFCVYSEGLRVMMEKKFDKSRIFLIIFHLHCVHLSAPHAIFAWRSLVKQATLKNSVPTLISTQFFTNLKNVFTTTVTPFSLLLFGCSLCVCESFRIDFTSWKPRTIFKRIDMLNSNWKWLHKRLTKHKKADDIFLQNDFIG